MTDSRDRIIFGEFDTSGNEHYRILKYISELDDDEIKELKDKKVKGEITTLDLENKIINESAKTNEELLEEEVSSLELLLKNDLNLLTEEDKPVSRYPKGKVKRITIQTLEDSLPEFEVTPIELDLTKIGNDIFSEQMNKTLDTVQSEPTEEVKESRIDKYRDEYKKRMQSIKTIEDYTEYTKWHKWYYEEDKKNLTVQAKVSAFILTVYVETRVYRNYGMDISRLLGEITLANYPVNKPEDVVPQVIAMAKRTTAVIEEEAHNFKSDTMTFEEFSNIRADNFVNMYTAFV